MKGFEISFETRTKDRILGQPAQAAQMRVERQQRRLATRRKFEANEESFRREHPQE
jgi:hypothetical protein